MYKNSVSVRVRYAETDQMGIVYHGNYAQYFEVGRVEAIRALGFSYKQMEEMGILMPLVELNIQYLRPAYYDDLLTITTEIKELPTNHAIVFHQQVHNQQNKLLTIAKVILYFVVAETKQKTAIPEWLYAALAPHFS